MKVRFAVAVRRDAVTVLTGVPWRTSLHSHQAGLSRNSDIGTTKLAAGATNGRFSIAAYVKRGVVMSCYIPLSY